MILFWNNTYYQGLSWDNNTREMFEPIPTYYYVINYLVGLVFISSLFVGLGLNPFIIMFNWSKRQSSVSLLFVITACADTLVCILIPMFYGALMVQPKIVFYDYMYEMYIVCIMCTFGCTSQVTTTLLGVCRFIKVMNPFYKINNSYIIIYLLLHVGYMFVQVIFIILLILGKIENTNNIQFKLVMACFIISALHCVVGSACSAFTVCKLYKSAGGTEDETLISEKRRSSVTILLMNLPHFITAGCIFTSVISPQGISWFDINFIFCPILTGTLNPLLIVTRSTAIRRMIQNYLRSARRYVTSERDESMKTRSMSGPNETGSSMIKSGAL